MNRVYYACFYAVSAVLLAEDRHFVKHAGVRSALHQYLVKPGRLSSDMGNFYDDVFRARLKGDYGQFVEFDPDLVRARLATAEQFVAEMKRLLGR
jgi:hypothetical protein